MKISTKILLRMFLIVVVTFCGYLIFNYLSVCFGGKIITQNSLFCRLCIDSEIDNFPLSGIIGEAFYKKNSAFTSDFETKPSDSLEFRSLNLPSDILLLSEGYLMGKGFTKVKDFEYEGASFQGFHQTFTRKNSIIEVEIQSFENDKTNRVIIIKRDE